MTKVFKRALGLWTLALGAVLGGCASPTHNYLPKITQISTPGIGEVATANVGDIMVSQGMRSEHDAIQVDRDIDVGLMSPYTITAGVFLKTGDGNGVEYYSIYNPFVGGGTIRKAFLADPPKAVEAYLSENKICGVSVFNAEVCTTQGAFTRIMKQLESSNSFQQSLIYSGKVGSRIKLGYREFSGNAARPAFNNDVDYDLAESTIIGYKGARLEVIEATNDHIRFKLISNFNTAR
jgi:hypothetical protein